MKWTVDTRLLTSILSTLTFLFSLTFVVLAFHRPRVFHPFAWVWLELMSMQTHLCAVQLWTPRGFTRTPCWWRAAEVKGLQWTTATHPPWRVTDRLWYSEWCLEGFFTFGAPSRSRRGMCNHQWKLQLVQGPFFLGKTGNIPQCTVNKAESQSSENMKFVNRPRFEFEIFKIIFSGLCRQLQTSNFSFTLKLKWISRQGSSLVMNAGSAALSEHFQVKPGGWFFPFCSLQNSLWISSPEWDHPRRRLLQREHKQALCCRFGFCSRPGPLTKFGLFRHVWGDPAETRWKGTEKMTRPI